MCEALAKEMQGQTNWRSLSPGVNDTLLCLEVRDVFIDLFNHFYPTILKPIFHAVRIS